MKYDQIIKIFTDIKKLKTEGIWFSGIENEGEYKLWHDNGKLYRHCFFKDGKRDGENNLWHKNGKLGLHSFYKNGKLNGKYKKWDSYGKLIVHKLYKDDKEIKDYLE